MKRLLKTIGTSLLAIGLMAIGLAGFLFFTSPGQSSLTQLSLAAIDIEQRIEQVDATWDQWEDRLERQVESTIPEDVRLFFAD
ncbi:hypothetical protein ACFQO8_01345 [Exiguobacterium aestuarii]|uniref:Methyl-accepting chemotaxis protein n=1 Tax=Exiguobacterium aestuarii TaxID=273527 RepID=A0ABW2PGZ2_9BACL|nr:MULTISPECIES: hypothetical protein [Exiguobacterium]MCT4784997.1 hypothetical protein [Exiguobacterium aestuarii]